MAEDPLRGTGRTIAHELQAIASALLGPDEWVAFEDHHPKSAIQARYFAEDLKRLAARLDLTIDVECDGKAVRLRSPITRMREENHRKLEMRRGQPEGGSSGT